MIIFCVDKILSCNCINTRKDGITEQPYKSQIRTKVNIFYVLFFQSFHQRPVYNAGIIYVINGAIQSRYGPFCATLQ